MCRDIGVVAPRPQAEVGSIANARIDEQPVEGIHQDTRREKLRARGGELPWNSASAALDQNLALYDDVCERPKGKDLCNWAWRAYKCILRPTRPTGARKWGMLRPVRMKQQLFHQHVYRLQGNSLQDWLFTTTALAQTSPMTVQRFETKLRKEYLRSVLTKASVYSTKDGQGQLVIYQVVDVVSLSRTFVKTAAEKSEELVLRTLLQEFQVWRQEGPENLVVTAIAEVKMRDFVRVAPWET